MKKKNLIACFAVGAALSCAFGFAACDNGDNGDNGDGANGAHTHEYTETVIAPTCTEKGYTLYTCTGCNESYKDNYVNALGHNYTANICTVCYGVDPAAPDTEGLIFTLNEDGKSYTLIRRGTASGDYLKIPATYNGKPVTEVGADAFEYCSWKFEALYIPDSVKIIGDYAFCGCEQLKGLTIPDCITEIGDNAFAYCQIEQISWGSGLTKIGGSAFGFNAIEEITLPDSVAEIGAGAFSCCENLTTLRLGSGITNIGGGLYAGCHNLRNISLDKNIKNYVLEDEILYDKDKVTLLCYNQQNTQEVFTVPYGVQTIGATAFSFSSYKNIVLPSSVTVIEMYAFATCESLTQINLPENLTKIGDGAFEGCEALETLVIPDKVTKIADYTFYGCESLKTVTLPASLTKIGGHAFESCRAFNEVIFKGTTEQWNAISKDEYWSRGVGDFTIRCTDGTLDKNGNVVE